MSGAGRGGHHPARAASAEGSPGGGGAGGRVPDRLAGHVRVRVGALVFDDPNAPTAVLLAEHNGLWSPEPFWTPPGGGVEFGEGLSEALVREVREETGVDVMVGPVRYALDFLRPPLHAVSFYLSCWADRPALAAARLGTDPELGDDQILRRLRLVPFDELNQITLYPEPFADRLARDARAGFPEGTVYLGTFR